MNAAALTREGAAEARTSFTVGGGPTVAADARSAIDPLRSRVGEELSGRLALIVSELVTNSYRHSGEPETIAVELAVTRDRVRCEVIDNGAGFRAQPVPEEDRIDGGWGLYIVDTLADRWGVYAGPPTRVWVELKR